MKNYKRGRVPDEEDKKSLENIWKWHKIVLDNKGEDEWFLFAALASLQQEIEEYFTKIGYYEK